MEGFYFFGFRIAVPSSKFLLFSEEEKEISCFVSVTKIFLLGF